MFALAMTLVVIISSLVLLYQFWAGSLAEPSGNTDSAANAESAPQRPAQPAHSFRADQAA